MGDRAACREVPGRSDCPDSGHPAPCSPPLGRRLLASRGFALRPGDLRKQEKNLRCGNPTRGGLPRWGRWGPGAWRPRPRYAAREAGRILAALSFPALSSFPLLPPAALPSARLTWRRDAGSRGRGGRGLRGGSRACSGAGSRAAATAAARSAPRPPLHQSFKLAWRRGRWARCPAPNDSTPGKPRPFAPLSVSFSTGARSGGHTCSTFPSHLGTLPVRGGPLT